MSTRRCPELLEVDGRTLRCAGPRDHSGGCYAWRPIPCLRCRRDIFDGAAIQCNDCPKCPEPWGTFCSEHCQTIWHAQQEARPLPALAARVGEVVQATRELRTALDALPVGTIPLATVQQVFFAVGALTARVELLHDRIRAAAAREVLDVA